MSHPLRVVTKRPCRLDRGELRRVSQDRRQLLIAYHLCCCGFVVRGFDLDEGLPMDLGKAVAEGGAELSIVAHGGAA